MPPARQLIIFGASGDLTRRKLMPALVRLTAQERLDGDFSIVGVSRSKKTDDSFRDEIRAALPASLGPAFDEIASAVHYVVGDASDAASISRLGQRLDALPGGPDAGRLFYLSLGPSLFAPAVEQLGNAGLLDCDADEPNAWRRVVIEKPFGHDLQSARALNRALRRVLREDQIYRIDHYLGKETVQNLLGFRFHNAIFEPLWNRHHVELVQITVAESIGVEHGRAGYYDQTGALRDMVQNHMLQVLALIAMEPPASLDPEAIRSQKVELLRALQHPDPEEIHETTVRARYAAGVIGGAPVRGYLQEEGVPHDSQTETFVALKASIDNWRWSGVPFLLRHGKRLAKRFTEVQVQFRMPPIQLFNRPAEMEDSEYRRMLEAGSLCTRPPNVLTLCLQPREAIKLSFGVKQPGAEMVMAPAKLAFDYRDHFQQTPSDAYERLLFDAMNGDQTLFLRHDEVEESWIYADQVIKAWQQPSAKPILEYPAGSWGPDTTEALFGTSPGAWTTGERPPVFVTEMPSETAGDLVAGFCREILGTKDHVSLAIPGGSAIAAVAAARQSLGPESWRRVHVTWVDERCVPGDDADSNQGAAHRNGALSKDAPAGMELLLYETGETPEQAIERVKRALVRDFDASIDVVLLGIGEDGHVASLFPGTGMDTNDLVAHVPDSPKPPASRITLTRRLLDTARHTVLLATGESKRNALERLLDDDAALPAHGLPSLVVVSDLLLAGDERAAAAIRGGANQS
jgi:glucose-6-phosphate 1-dehydrogenase